jgi:rhamnogalacturonyl hydrolase YesR
MRHEFSRSGPFDNSHLRRHNDRNPLGERERDCEKNGDDLLHCDFDHDTTALTLGGYSEDNISTCTRRNANTMTVAQMEFSRSNAVRSAVAVAAILCGSAWSADAISEMSVRELASKVNQYQKTHPYQEEDRGWIRGTYYTGVMAMYLAISDPAYLDQAMEWGARNNWQVGTDGSGGNKLTCVQTYLQIYMLKKQREMIQPAIDHLNSGQKKTPTGEALWYFEGGRRYSDSLYVGPPALAMLAQITGEDRYLDYMNAFFWDVYSELFDADSALFYRDKGYIAGRPAPPPPDPEIRNIRKSWLHTRTPAGKKVLWSRGNGWVFAGLARMLAYLPEDHHMRPKYLELYRAMAASLAHRQSSDGLWRVNLDDPSEYPQPETSGTGFFCYGFAWGVNHRILDRARYEPVARKAWTGLAKSVSPEGKVLWGQPVGSSPYEITEQDSHEYVSGTFLLAASEMIQLVRAEK